MKKTSIIAVIISSIAVLALVGCTAQPLSAQPTPQPQAAVENAVDGSAEQVSQQVEAPAAPGTGEAKEQTPAVHGGDIGEAEAKAIALEHAGLEEEQVTFVRCRLNYDDGRQEYEVKFWSGNTEYDYDIDANTGDILSFDQDAEYYAPEKPEPAQEKPAPDTSGDTIGSARAEEIALGHAGLSASQVEGLRSELDRDDGRAVYEVEFYSGRMEYDYEIDAYSGKIYESQKEYDD